MGKMTFISLFSCVSPVASTATARWNDVRYAAEWLRSGKTTKFSRRDLYTSARSRFRRAADVAPVLEVLIDCHWIRRDEEASRVGRPTEVFLVNPKVLAEAEPAQTDPGPVAEPLE